MVTNFPLFESFPSILGDNKTLCFPKAHWELLEITEWQDCKAIDSKKTREIKEQVSENTMQY